MPDRGAALARCGAAGAGRLPYGVGFLAIGGEWFAMWQSPVWNGQAKAANFILFIGLALLHLCGPDEG